jgi:hypothetical protein
MSERQLVALAFTLGEEISSSIFIRWLQILRAGDYHWPGPVVFAKSAYTTQARNICVDDFLEHPDFAACRALLFWDSDQLPPAMIPRPDGSLEWFSEHVDRVLDENPEKMVIGGLYFNRNSEFKKTPDGSKFEEYPHEPVAYERTSDDGLVGYKYIDIPRMHNQVLHDRFHLHAVGAVGTGSMIIRKQVFVELLALKAPENVFEAPPVPKGAKIPSGRQWTEDLYFCEEVSQKLGYPIWLDSAMESGHRGDQIWISSRHWYNARGVMTKPQPVMSESDQLRFDAALEKRKRRLLLRRP